MEIQKRLEAIANHNGYHEDIVAPQRTARDALRAIQKLSQNVAKLRAEILQARAEGERAGKIAMREQSAALLDLNINQLLLMAGEMTAQELRTVRAVLRNRAATIRAMKVEGETS